MSLKRIGKKLLTIILFCVLAMGFVSTADANDRWQWIASDDEMGVFFDTQSLQDTSSAYSKTYSVWIKWQYTEAYGKHKADKLGFKSAISCTLQMFEFGYKNKTMKTLDLIFYDKDGRILFSDDTPDKVLALAPGTWGEEIFNVTYAYYQKWRISYGSNL